MGVQGMRNSEAEGVKALPLKLPKSRIGDDKVFGAGGTRILGSSGEHYSCNR